MAEKLEKALADLATLRAERDAAQADLTVARYERDDARRDIAATRSRLERSGGESWGVSRGGVHGLADFDRNGGAVIESDPRVGYELRAYLHNGWLYVRRWSEGEEYSDGAPKGYAPRMVEKLHAFLAASQPSPSTPVPLETGGGERMFPVLAGGDGKEYGKLGMPRSVPWRLLAPHEEQAKRNHDQDLERLASRGGLGPLEMRAIVEGRRLWDFTWMKPADEFAWLTEWLRANAAAAPHPVQPRGEPR